MPRKKHVTHARDYLNYTIYCGSRFAQAPFDDRNPSCVECRKRVKAERQRGEPLAETCDICGETGRGQRLVNDDGVWFHCFDCDPDTDVQVSDGSE